MVPSFLTNKINRLFAIIDPWLGGPMLAFIYLVFLVYVPIKQRGGFANPEAYIFIPNHLFFGGNLFAHIFNQRALDNMGFQNRNLSYWVDYWDSMAIGWFARAGHPHFLSIFYLICVGALLWGLWYLFRKIFVLDRAPSFLICVLLLFTPAFQVSASYQRSSKIGTAIEVLLLTIFSAGVIFKKTPSRMGQVLLWFGIFTFSFFDFLAVSFCLYFILVCAAFLFLQEKKLFSLRLKTVLIFLGSILVINRAFGNYVVPLLHERFYGDRYYFAHAPEGRLWELLQKPVAWVMSVLGMCIDQIRFFTGTFPFGVAILISGLLLYLSYSLLEKKYGRRGAWLGLGALVLPILGIWAVLKIGHEPMFHELFRRLYYPLPFQVLLAIGAAVLLKALNDAYGANALWFAKVFLWLAILGSLSSLDGHVEVVRGSYIRGEIALSPRILAAVKKYSRTGQEADIDEEIRNNGLYMNLREYVRIKPKP